MRQPGLLLVLTAVVAACRDSTPPEPQPEPPVMKPQTIALIATPKIIKDFANPDSSVAAFLDNYASLTSRAATTVVIFAVGNSDHILMYRGLGTWADTVEWARYTNGLPVENRIMTFTQLQGILNSFRSRAGERGITLKLYDQVDSGVEFANNPFKWGRHQECMDWDWESWDIRATMAADAYQYATAPNGIAAGTLCGKFLVDQVAVYLNDFAFDGILYDNQLGTRGKWLPEDGPGHSVAEETAIKDFFAYSRAQYGTRGLMWFDSYNNTDVEHSSWSFPHESYFTMDFIIASGFCVITFPHRYKDNLASKLRIIGGPPVLATLDYVDPWYDTYASMTTYPEESAELEDVAIANRYKVSGVVFFANDPVGKPVPKAKIDAFAARYFAEPK